jgi:glyoxylase-like metal-dependent hydrolase (beta-lactamase superfamily II)
MDLRILSIGTLAANPLWNEKTPVRTGHATSTLIRSERAVIVVDPGLPEPAMAARLNERAGIRPEDVTHVFLTSFQPDTTRGILLFETAQWLVSREERERVGVPLALTLRRAMEGDDEQLKEMLNAQIAILQRCKEAPEKLERGVDLFPLPGVTPGLTGLLFSEPELTTLVAGDAVATIEHLAKGQVLSTSVDVKRARESLAEAVEVADVIVCGRDNWITNAGVMGF